MIIKTLNKKDFEAEWSDLVPRIEHPPKYDREYESIRAFLTDEYHKIITECKNSKKRDYIKDYRFGLVLYDFLNNEENFCHRVAADMGFWRFFSIKIIPHIVYERWKDLNPSHYGAKSGRIWLKTIWRFIDLSWQGSIEETRHILSLDQFSTDTILNLEDRSGRNGTHVETYRKIVNYYAKVPQDGSIKMKNDDLFRTVMKLNTAKLLVIEPSLYLNGEDGYVRSLFKEAGVDFDVTESN